MERKTVRKKPLSIIAATSMTVFSLLVVFVSAIAWFSMNQNTKNNGMNISVTRVDGRLQNVYVHAFDGDNSDEATFSFDKDAFASYSYDWNTRSMISNPNNPSSWKMGDFTSLDKDHPLLMIFAFDQDYASESIGDMYIKGSTTVGGFLGARDSNGAPYYSLPQTQVKDSEHQESILLRREPVYNDQGIQETYQDGTLKYNDYYALSSVVTFRNKTFSNAEYVIFNQGSYLSFDIETLESDESFTTINNATDRYVFNQDPYLFRSSGSGNIKYIALIIEYSQEAIGYIYSTYLGDSGLNKYDGLFHFNCDWSLEVC